MPPKKKSQSAETKRKLKEIEERNKFLEAQLANLQGANNGTKRGSSPTEQASTAKSIKRARIKKGKKGLKTNGLEDTEDVLKPTRDLVAKAIQEPVFALIKFAKGPDSAKKLCGYVLRFGDVPRMKKKDRDDWTFNMSDLCVGELNKHRSTVQTAIKGQFRAKYAASPTHDMGSITRWEACLTRDLAMTNDQDAADFAFYYNHIMDKATGSAKRWNEYHRGYLRLCDGKKPNGKREIDFYVTPETEAYALLIIKGNFRRWTAQFQAQDKFPQYKQKPIQKAPTAEVIAASNAIKERLYREQNGVADGADLPNNWLATMQLPWEQAEGTNNMVSFYVNFAHI